MLAHAGQAVIFGGFFTETKLGKTGLTVTVDVFRVALADLTTTQVVTGGSATSIGGGLYAYRHVTTSGAGYYYYAVFKTATTSVDLQHLPAVQIAGTSLTEAIPAAAPGASGGLPVIGSAPLTYLNVEVSTRLASDGYTSSPGVGEIATAVESVLDADFQAVLDAIEAGGGPTPAYSGTLATVTANGGTLTSPPAYSLAGYVVTVGGRSYEVSAHTGGEAAFTLRQNWKVNPTGGDTITADYFPDRTESLRAIALPMRRLDTIADPNALDGLAAATSLLAGDKTKAGTQLTVKHLDGTTAAVKTLDDADNPTSAT